MALIKCPECKTDISDKARSCPKCAYPIAELLNIAKDNTEQPVKDKVQTIEQTGKEYKTQILLSVALTVLGILLVFIGGYYLGFFLLFAGVVWFFVARTSAWWHHG